MRAEKENPAGGAADTGHNENEAADYSNNNQEAAGLSIKNLREVLPAIPSVVQALTRESSKSLAGPCPKCGGEDRFYYREDLERFACRKCHPEKGDVIDFHCWLEDTDFKGLCEKYIPEDTGDKHAEAVNYLMGRKISHSTIQQNLEAGKIWQQPYMEKQALAVLYGSLNGSDRGKRTIQYIPLDGGEKKFKKSSKAGEDFFTAGNPQAGTVVLTEAVINALSVVDILPQYRVIALGGSTFTGKTEKLKDYKVICFFDNDQAGQKAVEAVAKIMPNCRAVQWLKGDPAGYDPNDLLKVNQGHRIKEMVEAAKPVNQSQKPETGGGFTAAELLDMEFPEPRWAVEGILPEGLNILAGKPKQGKSIMALNIALSIAMGGKALESIDVEQGSATYFALEDTPRRLQTRLRQTLTYCKDKPRSLQLHTQWPRMGEGGLTALDNAIQKAEDLRLVIIDTYALFKPTNRGNNSNLYVEDYENINKIKRLADKHSVSILLVHHMRKMTSEDVFEMFSGTLGLTGAADGLLAMTKNQGNTTLHVTGRDVEPTELALDFDPRLLSWRVLGRAEDVQSTQEKQLLYDALKGAGEPLSPKEMAEMTGLKYQYIRNKLPKLLKDGLIKKASYGKYEYIEYIDYSEYSEYTEYTEYNSKKEESVLTPQNTEYSFNNNKNSDLNESVLSVPGVPGVPADTCKAYGSKSGRCNYTAVFLGKIGRDGQCDPENCPRSKDKKHN
ncbi:MAG: AAA family ATPase [Desulfosalsimonas sp.]